MPPAGASQIENFTHGFHSEHTHTHARAYQSTCIKNKHAGLLILTLRHVSKEMSCRLRASCMAAAEVLPVAGADGGGSCGDGPRHSDTNIHSGN